MLSPSRSKTAFPPFISRGMLTVKPTVVKNITMKTVSNVLSKVTNAMPEAKRIVFRMANVRPPTSGAGIQNLLKMVILRVSTFPSQYMTAPRATAWYILRLISVK